MYQSVYGISGGQSASENLHIWLATNGIINLIFLSKSITGDFLNIIRMMKQMLICSRVDSEIRQFILYLQL